jgi:hypothetical protein
MNVVDAANDFVGDKDRHTILFGRLTANNITRNGGPLSRGQRRQAAFWYPTATTFSQTFPGCQSRC